MKISLRPALFLAAALPSALFASAEIDRKIENTAEASYNYRTVLEDHIHVKATDGVVMLIGTVQDNDDKVLAEDTVANLPGVIRVDNEIVVTGSSSDHSDAWIALRIRATLLMKADVSAATTKVEVVDGMVTLSGTAENAAQKELTATYAKGIRGVKAVTNRITVDQVLSASLK